MTLKFEVAEGELAACTPMEQAAAIWKYYCNDTDTLQEIMDYLEIAMAGEENRQRNERTEPIVRYKTSYRSPISGRGGTSRPRVYYKSQEED